MTKVTKKEILIIAKETANKRVEYTKEYMKSVEESNKKIEEYEKEKIKTYNAAKNFVAL